MNRTNFYGEYVALLAFAGVFPGGGGGGDLARSDGELAGGELTGVAADGGGELTGELTGAKLEY